MSSPASGAFKASSLPDDAVELGRIQEAWGIKGWVRILPHSADTSALLASSQWFLQPPEARFARGDWLFFGKETEGLPADLWDTQPERCLTIPMRREARSINLAIAVGIVAYEALRQIGWPEGGPAAFS